ncbi:MAG: DUF3006 domain-containing protein [Halobacteriales archaeon]
MIPDGEYTAIVDQIEDGLAALEVTTGEERYELLPPVEALPEDAQQADAVLEVEIQNGEIVGAEYNRAATSSRSEQAQDRFDRLSQRPPNDEDGGDG